jgi:SAM-dependent methyltransferase
MNSGTDVPRGHDLDRIRASGWEFPAAVWDQLSDYDRRFALLEFAEPRTAEFYRKRIRAVGFTGARAVLDAGCGMGQWSAVLAEANGRVEGIDVDEDRLSVAAALCGQTGLSNCGFLAGSMEAMPFADASFDGVFCYGAFMFTDMPRTLEEFARVLRPGGRLYLNANTFGWYAHLILDRGLRGRDWTLARQASTMVWRAVSGGRARMLVWESWLRRLIGNNGFELVALATEGHIRLNGAEGNASLPGYPGSFYGMQSIIEVVAVRR